MNNNVGNFFVTIGEGIKKAFFSVVDWVKNTAWVQPLLIVGVIFGVILGIKPTINFIGGLFNPDTSFVFYRDRTVSDMTDILNKLDDTKTSIIIFYSDSDSSSQSIETSLITYSSENKNINWYCVDVLDNSSDEDIQEENQRKR